MVCPFCSLLCDDLVIETRGGKLKLRDKGCPRAAAGYENTPATARPRIDGKPAGLEQALERARDLLRKSRRPLIAGLGTDVAGMRAALKLADRTGAIIDHMHSEGAFRNLRILQERGWIMTTLTEIRNRADLLLFVGTDAIRVHPRFFERIVWPESALFLRDPAQREIVYLGDGLDTRSGVRPDGKPPTVIDCPAEDLAQALALLKAQVRGVEPALPIPKALAQLANKLAAASYGVLIWSPGELATPHADLIVQAACELITILNEKTRFSGLSLGGNDGGITAMGVCTWQSGYPLRASFSRGYPEYDPGRFSASSVLQRGEADLLIWISCFAGQASLPETDIDTIAIADPATELARWPRVFIPVGVPGMDHTGQVLRVDGAVSLPLRQVRHSRLPSAADVIAQL